MRKLLLALFTLSWFTSLSQLTQPLIVKYKIKKVTLKTISESSSTPTISVAVFDEKGYQVESTTYGNTEKTTYSYDKNDRIVNKQITTADGKVKLLYKYTYAADGSYTVEDTDTQFQLTSTKWHNAKGQLVKSQSPDGSIYTFTYDTNGNVTKTVKTEEGKSPIIKTAKYKLDKAGRIVEESWSDGSTTKTSYDAKGLPVKKIIRTTGNEELAEYNATMTIKYEFYKEKKQA